MTDDDLLFSAERIARKHPADELSKAFLEAYHCPERDLKKCLVLAAKLVLKLD